ncbi:RNB domain-containing protein [Ditylenchus destructor]|uniref:Protein DIS3 homolog n=1 Tax=Ditylenchus destructor TaxID=166010 RepID=A0AAD4N8T2_9BILA|nr:RNB domain-containing protein [Ditylenchus destructor]
MELNVKQSGIERRTFTVTYRKTLNNKVHKRVHELYLRNDIPCGLKRCMTCKANAGSDMKLLDVRDNSTHSKAAPYCHMLLIDGISLLKFIDVLDEDIFRNIIVPQSAWNYVKKLNPSIYKRVNKLYTENQDRLFVFLNEFVEATFVDPGLNRVPELYQEKCLLRVAIYLESHWESLGCQPILICSSDETKQRMRENFENTKTLMEYVEGIDGASKIAERLADLSKTESRGKALFPEYWTQDALLDGISKGTLKKGKFQISTENYLEAYINFDFGEQWFIQGRKSMNRAIHGDTVVAQLLPESEWTCPEKVIRLRDAEEAQTEEAVEDDEGLEEKLDEEITESTPSKRLKKDVVPTAQIVGILRRNWRNYCGVIMPAHIEGGRRFLFAPTERLISRIRIETSHYEDLKNKKLLVQIDNWPQDSYYPKGHYIRVIGTEGEQETEDEVILLEHEIPHAEFSPAVMACLPGEDWKPDPEPYRQDLTHLDICSVDPPGCTDIDDALHCSDLGNGRYEVGVHIADVTHFVRPSTAIDTEAAERSTSVYLCGRRIDMLPILLSSNLCSLREDQPRYAFSVIWILREDASIENVRFTKSLIKSRRAFTYQAAQEMVDDTKTYTDNISQSLRNLMKLSRCLKANRKIMGALELASSEIRFEMDYETRTPKSVQEKQHLATMSMVEEFMLLANISVAEKILKAYPDCAILRRHPVPSRDAFKPLSIAAEACGFKLNVDTGKELAKSLDEVDLKYKEKGMQSDVGRMLRMLATRCMTQAVYFAAGTVSQDQYLHYGLAAKVYTHFTSPIRRYADVMVHRLLAAVIEADKIHPVMLDRKKLIRLTENMNRRHRQAQYASRASILLNTYLMIKTHPEPRIRAIVIGIRSNGIQVIIPKYGLESVIFFTATQKMQSQEQMMEYCNDKIRLFQEVEVSVELVEKNQRRRINVTLLKPFIEGFSVVTGCETDMPKLNPSIYKRVNKLYTENQDRLFVFLNEFVEATFVDPGLNRVPELYQEKCLLRVAIYLESHWESLGCQPILICSSDETKQRMRENFENTKTLMEYVEGIDGASKIAERLADLSKTESRGKALFPEYWTQDALLDGISKGTLKKENSSVVAQLLPESEWTCPEKVIRLRDAEEAQTEEAVEDDEGLEEKLDEEITESTPSKRLKKDVVPTAQIVGILRRNWRGRRFLFAPTERLISRIRIETSHYEDLKNKKLLVQIDNWPQDSYYPKGHYIRVIGTEGEQETEDEVILLEHEIPHAEFSPAVMACLPGEDWKPDPEPYRQDLTHLDICSVDPPGCTDIDDALHCSDLGNGRYEVGVHIADVTHFVRPSTAIDTEAAERSTSVYLCGRRIDMLPILLSSNLCSLREDQPRYAFSVIWILREDASIENVRFTKSLIKSRRAFTYQAAQEMVDDTKTYTDNISQSLRNLMKLSRCLKANRKIMGALELASSEIRFEMDYETRTPKSVQEKQHLATMSMVEEFMLLANISVAEKILKAYPDCAILRRHPVPSRDAFKPLSIAAEACGFKLNVDTGKELAKSLDEVDLKYKEKGMQSDVGRMLRMLATRCMTQAVYFAAGTVSQDQYLHYGLAAKVYTHFTSPIRRYADVMVHRLLAAVIEADKIHPVMLDRKKLIRLTENMNRRHRQAQYASRASILLNTYLMIKTHPEPRIRAIVIGIRSNGIQVIIPKYGLESVIFFTATQKMQSQEQMMEYCNDKIRLFQEVEVSVELVEKNQRRRINVTLLKPFIEGFSVVTGCETDMPV